MAKRTLDNCTLIKRMQKEPYLLGIPRQYRHEWRNDQCEGYTQDEGETHDTCKDCKLCTSYEEE